MQKRDRFFSKNAQFRLDQWRDDIAYRREKVRTVALDIILDGPECREGHLAQFRSWFAYDEMSENDSLNLRQNVSYIHKIVNGWDSADDQLRADFVAGRVAPSTMARRVTPPRRSA